MTRIGPLTTTFSAPPHCSASSGLHISQLVAPDGGWWAEGPLQTDPYDCFPESYNPTIKNFYSPGFCPQGYTPGCTSKNTVASLTETVYTCCPTAGGHSFSCIPGASHTWMSTLACDLWIYAETGKMLTFDAVTYIAGTSTKMTSTQLPSVGIGAHGIEVRFQAGDFQALGESGSQTTSPSRSGSSVGTTRILDSSQSSSTSAAQTEVAASSGGMSTGAAAGIGVGVTVVAAALVGMAIWVWRRKRKAKADEIAKTEHATPAHAFQYPIPVTPGTVPIWGGNHEKDGVVTPVPHHEIDTRHDRYELPSNPQGRAEAP